jgi:hypothetical protein
MHEPLCLFDPRFLFYWSAVITMSALPVLLCVSLISLCVLSAAISPWHLLFPLQFLSFRFSSHCLHRGSRSAPQSDILLRLTVWSMAMIQAKHVFIAQGWTHFCESANHSIGKSTSYTRYRSRGSVDLVPTIWDRVCLKIFGL